MLSTFAIVAEPSRRRIMDMLLRGDASVSQLVEALDMSQPLVSKHLRALRETGLVRVRIVAQQRIYSLEPGPLAEIDMWLSAYRSKWNRHVDAMDEYLKKKKQLRKEEEES
ncbi:MULTISPECIES: ArsR/SmtB family transcription factor [Paenibacillus]|uniref:Transcriptional regulator n=1 Tax=Paenibacillus glycanilyticus TaxID=126569 RepID=A0ABQ6NHT0_9BACL|nr:metalloregulator ArsR/SmtB family transcription factor [Paenibacillus glycanilyticus]MCK9857635.1 metalloregulator ArsR/SmtB family transcription factor [Paenibacillus sp. ATY16]GMK43762.1 transcriptional regulator [Paenibacillus glycanilyticus]